MKKGIIRMMFLFLAGVTSIEGVVSQDTGSRNHDYLMPAKGKSMVELYSGIPYVAIGQYAYGFSNRFSVGIIYGLTPISAGYGLRLKAVLAQPSESWRIYMKAPIIYYPKVSKTEKDPWLLTWPSLDVERKFKNGAKAWVGVGLVGVACTDYLFHPNEEKVMTPPDGDQPMVKEEAMTGLWNTFQFGYSKPFSDKLSFVAEIAPVMEGFRLKSDSGFLDAIPVIATVGLSYTF